MKPVDIPSEPREKSRYVQSLFDSIAGTYDLLNSLLSFHIDSLWRKRTVKLANVPQGGTVLDLCTGTGKLAFDFARYSLAGNVIGTDFSPVMIETAHKLLQRHPQKTKVEFQTGDALDIHYPDNQFDAVTCAFGLRNLVDSDQYFRETYRVTKPGGKILTLELTRPANPLMKIIYYPYLKIYLPIMGRLVSGHGAAYDYLAQTISEFTSPEVLAEKMRLAGWKDVQIIPLTGGISTLLMGTKP